MSKRLLQYGIVVDGDDLSDFEQGNYEAWVGGMLVMLSMFGTPRAIFHKIKVHGGVYGGVRIVPWGPSDVSKYGKCNATGDDPDSDWPEPQGAFFGIPGRATVHFSPMTWSSGSCGSGAGSQAQDVLLHELVHAARFLGRDQNQKPLTGAMSGYDDEEEFFAILVTNIYISESQRSNLRLDHHGNASIPSPMNKSEAFLGVPENYRLVAKFCSQHPNIAPMIARANAAFNPIKTYYDWRARNIKPNAIEWILAQSSAGGT